MSMQEMEILRGKIIRKLEEPEVTVDGDIISYYDLDKSLEEEMHPFTNFFMEDNKNVSKKMNLKSRINNIVGKPTPYISEVIPEVRNGESLITVKLYESNNDYLGDIEIINGSVAPRLKGIKDFKLKDKYICKFILDCVGNFNHELKVLDYFQERHPGIDYRWSITNPDPKSTFRVDDGFMSGGINLNDGKTRNVTLSQTGDLGLATYRTSKYGILYDYIDFYNDAFKRRLAVNVNDLNPLMRQIVDESLSLEKGPTLTL